MVHVFIRRWLETGEPVLTLDFVRRWMDGNVVKVLCTFGKGDCLLMDLNYQAAHNVLPCL